MPSATIVADRNGNNIFNPDEYTEKYGMLMGPAEHYYQDQMAQQAEALQAQQQAEAQAQAQAAAEARAANRQRNAFTNPTTGALGMGGSRRFLSNIQKMSSQPGGISQSMASFPLQQYADRGISGGVRPGHFQGPNAVQQARMNDAQRMQQGAAMGPQNAALSGYMMGR